MQIKPILFNTEMVKAILQGRKTQTRRLIRIKYGNTHIDKLKCGVIVEIEDEVEGINIFHHPDGSTTHRLLAAIEKKPPYKPGDILWVRETWNVNNLREKKPGEFEAGFIYAASEAPPNGFRWVKTSEENYQKYEDGMSWYFSGWRPSIHMPKEAARIFLRVQDVRAERLKSITPFDAMDEGFTDWNDLQRGWDSTIRKEDIPRYGWFANPWVWRIVFERTDKPEEWP